MQRAKPRPRHTARQAKGLMMRWQNMQNIIREQAPETCPSSGADTCIELYSVHLITLLSVYGILQHVMILYSSSYFYNRCCVDLNGSQSPLINIE